MGLGKEDGGCKDGLLMLKTSANPGVDGVGIKTVTK